MAAKQSAKCAAETSNKGSAQSATGKKKLLEWKKPVLEDVSGKVMAQPYIRFT